MRPDSLLVIHLLRELVEHLQGIGVDAREDDFVELLQELKVGVEGIGRPSLVVERRYHLEGVDSLLDSVRGVDGYAA